MSLGNTSSHSEYYLQDDSGRHLLEHTKNEKDLGVVFDTHLNFESHMKEKINKAQSMMALIRRTYKYLDSIQFKNLFSSTVRSHLEYASSVWCPFKIKYLTEIENVQRRATKQIPGFKNYTYEERLKKLKLPTLVFRRIRGDMIETYKILNNIYHEEISPKLKLANSNTYNLRGHTLKLEKMRCATNLRLHSFPLRITTTWNSLPDTVITAPSVNSFKNRLDKYWSSQELMYDYRAVLDLHTGIQLGEEDLAVEV